LRHSVPDFRREVIVVLSEEHPDDTTSFTVPECLLVETSEFFKAACRDGAWLESTSRTIKLPEVDADVFNAYLLWAHRKELPTAPSDDAFELVEDLVRLWLLADHLADFRLRNAVIDAILVELNSFTTSLNVFPPELAAQVWSATTPGRSIRCLIIDYYAKHVGAATVQAQVADYHVDFTRDLLVKAIEVVKNDEENICPSKRDSCFYHEYESRYE
jgi:hypothetical protein